MEELRKDAYTPNLLSEDKDNIKFRIPLYQRPFSWEVQQVRQLLEDLYDQFKFNKNNKEEEYYIGILSLGKTDDDNLYELIDGQQRIITLILIGSILNLYENSQNESGENSNWDKFIKDRINFYGREGDKNLVEYLSNKELFLGEGELKDIKYKIKEVATNKVQNANPVIIDALQEICDFFIENNNEIDISGFSEYVFNNTSFFLTQLPIDYTVIEKNKHFVRMNNRGKQLELHDILKMKLASKINNEKERENFIIIWNEISQLGCNKNEIENNDNSNATIEDNNKEKGMALQDILEDSSTLPSEPKEIEIYHQSILSFPEFLLIALDRSGNKEISHNTDRLLEEFGFRAQEDKWYEEDVRNFLDKLINQFFIFDKYFIKRDNYQFRNEDYFKKQEESTIKKLSMFQSYLFVSREKHRWMVDAFDKIEGIWKESNNVIINAENMLKELKNIDNNKANIDLISKSESNNKDSQELLNYKNINRYWFWRLDYYLWEDMKKNFNDQDMEIVKNYKFRTNRSIEHIAPQNPKNNSKINFNDPSLLPLLHVFGNLAMISSEQNSKMQNETFEVKKAYADAFRKGEKSGTIESLKLLKAMEYYDWECGKIKEHHNEMIDVLIDSFSDGGWPDSKKILENCKF